MGYIEETGAAQHLRDARISPIYEGTNGIQAIDLVSRKVLRDKGRAVHVLVEEMRATQSALAGASAPELARLAPAFAQSLDDLEATTAWVLDHASPLDAQGAATPYAMMFGLAAGGWLMMVAALEAHKRLQAGEGDPKRWKAKIGTAQFFADAILPFTGAHRAAAIAGPASLMALEEDWF